MMIMRRKNNRVVLMGAFLALSFFCVSPAPAAELPKIKGIYSGTPDEGKSVIVTVEGKNGFKDYRMQLSPKVVIRLEDGTRLELEDITPGDKVEISYQEVSQGDKKSYLAVIIVVTPSPA